MIYRQPRVDEQAAYDKLVKHPLQSRAWGDFRETTGATVHRLIGFEGSQPAAQMQITFHPIPKLPYTIGYYPKGTWPDEVALAALRELGKREKAILIKMEPDISNPPYTEIDLDKLRQFLTDHGAQTGRALFTPYTFLVDLSLSEEQLIANMKTKTRYNIKVALKHGVQIMEDNSTQGFSQYLKLLQETTKRQQFYAHTQDYQLKMWKQMREADIAHLLKAVYQDKVLAAWIVFKFQDRLFYPYGASSREHREVMASNLLMWEAMRFGKRLGCQTFDLWGALGPNPNPKDPWLGFHRFKEGYGGVYAHFVGTYDLVIDPVWYKLFRMGDRWRWRLLRLKSKFSRMG